MLFFLYCGYRPLQCCAFAVCGYRPSLCCLFTVVVSGLLHAVHSLLWVQAFCMLYIHCFGYRPSACCLFTVVVIGLINAELSHLTLRGLVKFKLCNAFLDNCDDQKCCQQIIKESEMP